MTRNGKITWTNEKRRLGDLIPWPRNPRMIKQDQGKRLVQSLEEFNQVEPIAIGPGNVLYNGHQRLNVWAAEHGEDLEVDVRVASRPLTEKEREKLTVYLHKGAAGEWDFDLLSEFNVDELLEWGFKPFELGIQSDIDPNAEWEGMPEYENSAKAIKTLYIHFETENDIRDFENLIGQKIGDKTKYIWYPEHKVRDMKSLEFINES